MKRKQIIRNDKPKNRVAKELKPFDRNQNPEDSTQADAVKAAALKLVPGQLSEPVINPDGALIVYLAARNTPKRDSEPEDRKLLVDELNGSAAARGFDAWFQARRAETNVKRPVVKDRDGNTIPMSIESFAPRN